MYFENEKKSNRFSQVGVDRRPVAVWFARVHINTFIYRWKSTKWHLVNRLSSTLCFYCADAIFKWCEQYLNFQWLVLNVIVHKDRDKRKIHRHRLCIWMNMLNVLASGQSKRSRTIGIFSNWLLCCVFIFFLSLHFFHFCSVFAELPPASCMCRCMLFLAISCHVNIEIYHKILLKSWILRRKTCTS